MVTPDNPAYENKPSNWNEAHDVAGATSGGIPYFDSTTSEATSALLAQYGVVIGGGAGNAPATLAALGTSGWVLTSAGAGNPPAFAAPAAATPSYPVTVAGTVTSGGIPYFSSTTVESSSGVLTAGRVVLGGGAGNAPNDNANLIFAATSSPGSGPLFTAGSGSGTSAGVSIGYYGSSGYSGLWSTAVTPSGSNYALAMASGETILNSPSGGKTSIRVNHQDRLTCQTAGTCTFEPGVATPANGSTSARLLFGSTAGFGIYFGTGAPTVSAGQGSIYINAGGSGIADRLYVNTNGSTTWTNFVSAA